MKEQPLRSCNSTAEHRSRVILDNRYRHGKTIPEVDEMEPEDLVTHMRRHIGSRITEGFRIIGQDDN